VATISDGELRDHVNKVLHRVAAGETLIVTVDGREVAELTPVRNRQWVNGAALSRVWTRAAFSQPDDDVPGVDASVVDPFHA
jgi:prevent-host-death family protein